MAAMDVADSKLAVAGARESLAWYAIPVVAILASYAIVLTGGFVWDDYYLIVNSPLVSGGASLVKHFSQPFSNNPLVEARSFYRPLTTLSYALDHRLWASWAGGFHLTNLLLHTAFALLLVAACRRAGASRPLASLLATLFALSPRLSESVAWISGRTDIAAGIGALAALLLYQSGPGAWARRFLAGLALLLGLLCKEVALVGAVALIPLIWLQAKRPPRLLRLAVELLPIGMAIVTYALLRSWAMGTSHDEVLAPYREATQVLLLASNAVARYTWMVLDPFQPNLQIGDVLAPSLLLSGIGTALLIGAAFVLWRWRGRLAAHPWIGVAIVLGATSMGLVSHLVYLNLNVVAADRFLYLPLAALAIGLAGVGERLWQRHRTRALLGAAVLISVFGLTTADRARTWAAELQLWRQAVAKSSPEQALPRIELGAALMRRGRFNEALADLNQVPKSRKALAAVNIAICLDKLGHRAAAIKTVEALLSLEPRRASAHMNLMLLYARDRRFEAARSVGQQMLTDFADRIDIPPLVAGINQAISELERLPAGAANDPIEQRVRRASLYDQLGALPEAQSLWRAIAFDPGADPRLRLRGAAYVALFGHPDLARETLGQLSNEAFATAEMPALRAAFESRFDDG
jgi:tetratricopeptide (TPR) repeat protein